MKIVFTVTLAMLVATLHAEPIEPMTGKGAVSQASAIAAKFSDVYSQDPSRVLDFTIGSSVKESLASEGIEKITIVCIDGFTKTYDVGTPSMSKTKKITYKDIDSGLVEFDDGTSLHAKQYQCSVRPISFIIYRKIKS